MTYDALGASRLGRTFFRLVSISRLIPTLLLLCGVLSCEGSLGGSASLVACAAEELACNGRCIDPQSDTNHCGSCNSACAAGAACTDGTCVAPDGRVVPAVSTPAGVCAPGQRDCTASCVSGETKCGADCVDLQRDSDHCGACGTPCGDSEVCTAGACDCEPGAISCGDVCAELQTDTANCGSCGISCAAGQVCAAGSCQCPEGESLCSGACRSLLTDVEHCGVCDNPCGDGEVCGEGECACPSGEISCDEKCTDPQTDSTNCGACGNSCTGGQTCQEGDCACPEGQTLCDGSCIDTRSDRQNCGGCGTACGLGEGCSVGECIGGAMGDDGCSGVATGIEIDEIKLYQTIELPIVRDGEELEERSVDVVAGRPTLVRVFAKVGQQWESRKLSARLFLANGDESFTLYTKEAQTFAESSFDESRNGSFAAARASSFEFMVDGLDANQSDAVVITPETRYAVEIVECGDVGDSPMLTPRFPTTGSAEMGAVDVGPMRIRFVPLRSNGITPDTSEEALAPLLAGLRATYPTATIEHSVRDVAEVRDARDWVSNLDQLRDLRSRDNADQDIYYYGLLKPAENIFDFCGRGCVSGIGYVPTGIGRGYNEQRAALGLAFGEAALETMLHEVGHNLGREHAPCAQGGQIQGVDRDYPHQDAKLGVRGYNILTDKLVSENQPDIMGYCEGPWFSDYTYGGMLERIRAVNGANRSFIPDQARFGDFNVLLLEAGKSGKWGAPVIDGVASGNPERALILDASGTIIENVEVFRMAISDIDASSIEVPAPKPGWHSVQVHGHAPVAF